MTACALHPRAFVHHVAVRIGWKDRRVWVDHVCEGAGKAHDWSEPAVNVAGVLAHVGLRLAVEGGAE